MYTYREPSLKSVPLETVFETVFRCLWIPWCGASEISCVQADQSSAGTDACAQRTSKPHLGEVKSLGCSPREQPGRSQKLAQRVA